MGVDAYARIKGFGVGLVTSGPGATNLTTGIACSFMIQFQVFILQGK